MGVPFVSETPICDLWEGHVSSMAVTVSFGIRVCSHGEIWKRSSAACLSTVQSFL